MLTEARGEFCARLRAAREAKSVSIDEIAASTKISASLLRALERGDLSRWPPGLFRRSYLRDYLRLIGLPPDPVIAEFLRLFPHPNDDTPAIERVPHVTGHDAAPLSMMLVDDPSGRASRMRARLTAASIDAVIVGGTSIASALVLRIDAGIIVAGVAVAYHAATTIALGGTIGTRWTTDRRVARWKRSGVHPAPIAHPEPEAMPAEDPPPKALPSVSTA